MFGIFMCRSAEKNGAIFVQFRGGILRKSLTKARSVAIIQVVKFAAVGGGCKEKL